ncbi:MAG: dTDP-4-amino-4,6-dideoxygalactose transaminase [Gemmatimonadales bacterium]
MPATSTTYAIPLHRPPFEDADARAIVAALKDGLLTGDGAANERLAQAAQRTLGCHRAYATPSGTHALELMMRALPLAPGDEVICPSFTFVSVANAIILAGGTPVFADVEAATLNLDPGSVHERLSPRTRAIVTAHYGGIAFGLETLESLALSRDVALLEDAAHALGGSYRGRPLGTWGRAAAFSFHGTKNLVAGEGGLFVTTDAALAARAEIIREKGTDRSRFLRGDVDRYTWQAVGSSYLMSDVLAALIFAQWSRIDAITAARRERFEEYQQAFAPLAAAGHLTRPTVPDGGEPAYHIYYVLVDAKATRDRLVAWMRGRGIEASSHFVPLHLSPYAASVLGVSRGLCPVTESVADRLVRLPLYPALSPVDQQTVAHAVASFFGRSGT